jgi:uncharacterized protein (DUF1697 family)
VAHEHPRPWYGVIMATGRFVALLRGVNVGGNNRVGMADLRQVFMGDGYANVATYIQSGNVIFDADGIGAGLEPRIEDMLVREFGLAVIVVVRSLAQMRNVARRAPDGFGDDPDRYHSDAVFVKAPLTPRQLLKVVELREGVDRAWAGPGLVYFQRLSARRTQSRMSRIASNPEYANLTIRNWRTTMRLLEMLEGSPQGR